MPTGRQKAEQFAKLHVKGDPLILFNIWDAGSAKRLAELGAKAIATGSHAVGLALGYDDGELTPLDIVVDNLERIASAVDLPVTLDFESGYAEDPQQIKENAARVLEAGAIGINFEDQIIGTEQLYGSDVQSTRIRAVREAADAKDIPLFINARDDLFLKNGAEKHADLLDEAIERAHSYADAGASGFFAPALVDPALIKQLCEASPLPVNILMWPGVPTPRELASLGVARISYGSRPYVTLMESFKESATRALQLES